MAQQFRLKDGTIVESLPGGGYREVVSANGPIDPKIAPTVRKLTNEAAASDYAPGAAAAELTIKRADAANANIIAAAQRDKSVADAEKARADAETAKINKMIDPTVRKGALDGYKTAQALRDMVANINQKFQDGPGSTTGLKGLTDYLPYTANKQLDTAANTARGIVGSALGFTGGQLNTQQEAEKAVGPYLPQADDRDEVARDKIITLNKLADTAEAKAIAILGGRPDVNGVITPVETDKTSALMGSAADPAGNVALGGKTQTVADPMLRAIGQHAARMAMKPGATQANVDAYLKTQNVPPGTVNVKQLFQWKTSPPGAAWIKANPGQPFPLDPSFYNKEVPLSDTRAYWNRNAQSAPGTALSAFANSALAGQLPNVIGATGGNADLARTGLDMTRAENPGPALLGDIGGQVANEAVLSRVPGMNALLASRWGRRGMDAAYGASTGQGQGGDLTSALEGAAFNAGGGVLGRNVQRAGAGALTGVKDTSLKYLNQQGVPLTIGRIARGAENRGAKFVAGLEERLMGLPGPDAMIGAARKRGDVGFNQAAFRQMGGTGATGAGGITEGEGLVNNAYSFLDNSKLPLDAQYAGSQAGVRAGLPQLPAYAPEVKTVLDNLDQTAAGGVLSGRDWQSGIRSVRADGASIAGQPFGDRASTALGDVQGNLLDLAARQGPAGSLPALADANRLNAQFQTVSKALDTGPAQRAAELFSPQGLDTAARQARNFGGRTASLTGNRPFYDLTKAGLESMPNLTPDSGTAGRLMILPAMGAALGGGAGAITGDSGNKGESGASGAIKGALLAAALEGLYSKPAQSGIQKALLSDRPKAVSNMGEWLANHLNILGYGGSGLARSAIYPQQP